MEVIRTSRREFIKLAAAGAVAAGSAKSMLGSVQAISPNDRIRLALIGAGGQGTADTRVALKVPGVELVAVADLYNGRLVHAKETWGEIMTTRDYREILSRPDVDAVIIGTPDHWHARIAVDAMNAGKDVYCEKPMVQKWEDGHLLIEAARKNNRIIEVGSQGVSSIMNARARELYQSGALGELNMVEAFINRNSPVSAWQYTIPPDASPETVDWDRFLGNAPKRPFDAVRFFRWRNYRDYGTGIPGDLFVHLFSGMHRVLGSNGPTRIMATGGLRFWKDGRDVPDVMLGLYDYPQTSTHPAFNLVLKVNFVDGGTSSMWGDSSFRFIGSEGVMTLGGNVTVTRRTGLREPGNSIDTFPKAMQEQLAKEYREKYLENRQPTGIGSTQTFIAPEGYSDHLDHFTNFFNAVRTRKPVVEDAVFGLRAAGPAVLSNQCIFENCVYRWDPESMKVTGKSEA